MILSEFELGWVVVYEKGGLAPASNSSHLANHIRIPDLTARIEVLILDCTKNRPPQQLLSQTREGSIWCTPRESRTTSCEIISMVQSFSSKAETGNGDAQDNRAPTPKVKNQDTRLILTIVWSYARYWFRGRHLNTHISSRLASWNRHPPPQPFHSSRTCPSHHYYEKFSLRKMNRHYGE